MKKIIALILTVALMFAISVPTFADVVSPENPVNYTVTYFGVKGVLDASTSSVKAGETVTVAPDTARGEFIGWDIVGSYELKAGTLTADSITVLPKSDITITAKFKNTEAPKEEAKDTDYNNSGKYDVQVIGGTGVNENGSNDASWSKNKAIVAFDATKNQLTASALDNNGTFDNWSIYTVKTGTDGKKSYSAAVEGVHYSLVVDYDSVEKEITPTEEYNTAKAAYENAINNSTPENYATLTAASDNYFNVLAKLYNTDKDSLITKLLKEKKITIIPLADIVICGNYDGKTTSPKTADNSIYFAFIAVLALAGVVISSKKVLSK